MTYQNEQVIELPVPECPVVDEVLVVFYGRSTIGKKKKILSFWYHTSYLPGDGVLTIEKKHMDKAVKDKKHKKYSKGFQVQVLHKDAPEAATDPRPSHHDVM
eukprot:FR739048.1.p2 GENE.FR739048.1~~FR739048.1.p2  ORF type:complete len:117 (+),score=11.74 FR739048.1:47-352(+)